MRQSRIVYNATGAKVVGDEVFQFLQIVEASYASTVIIMSHRSLTRLYVSAATKFCRKAIDIQDSGYWSLKTL